MLNLTMALWDRNSTDSSLPVFLVDWNRFDNPDNRPGALVGIFSILGGDER